MPPHAKLPTSSSRHLRPNRVCTVKAEPFYKKVTEATSKTRWGQTPPSPQSKQTAHEIRQGGLDSQYSAAQTHRREPDFLKRLNLALDESSLGSDRQNDRLSDAPRAFVLRARMGH